MTHLRKQDYEVRPADKREAADLVRSLHYSGGVSKVGADVHGLFLAGTDTLLGAAWWLPPTKNAAVSVAGDDWRACVSLSRLVVAAEVPCNGASFLLAGSRRLLKKDGRWRVLVTYADTGEGHTGAIYRADNWNYLGETKAAFRYRGEDGVLMSKKRGARTYSHREMLDMGFVAEGPFVKHKYSRVV